eukprot:NODE_77_length_23338_cov_0.319463.p3 type:complete len:585 gc:universal NODE_77_length_23338_cov_0.319463:625-2379(+)
MILVSLCLGIVLNSTVTQLFKYSTWLQKSLQIRMDEDLGTGEYLEEKYNELVALHTTIEHSVNLLVNATGFKGLHAYDPQKDIDEIIRSASIIHQYLDTQDNSAERHQKLGDLMEQIKNAADSIDANIQEDVFKQKLNNKGNLETLIKNDFTLLDSHNNEYTIRKFNDFTYWEDIDLLNDIILLFVSATIIGILCNVIQLPIFLGHLIAGALLGPYGYNLIHNMVQVETLGQLGVLLILFALGMEFSIDKIRKIWKIALNTSLGLILACAFGVVLAKSLLQLTILESFLIGLNISLSSTIVVLKFMSPGELEECGKITLGILISQDIILSVLLAILPIFAEPSFLMLAWSCLTLIFKISIFYCVCYVVRTPVLTLFKWLNTRRDVVLLGVVGYCFILARISLILNLSSELGCFVAGFLLSFDKKTSHSLFKVVDPIKDFMGCLFFASIGLQLNFKFLIKEFYIVSLFSIMIVLLKYVYIFVNIYYLHNVHKRDAFIIGLRLAQISEFSYMLMAKSKTLHLLSREMYHLMVGVTTMTLIINILMSMAFNKYVLKQDVYQYRLTKIPIKTHSKRNSETVYEEDFRV